MARCKVPVRKADKEKPEIPCIVPLLADGKHVDGNAAHYNGASHWTAAGWTRG